MHPTVTTPEPREAEAYYTQLYRDHAGAVLNYIRSRLHSHEEAQDILHEVFLRAWQHRETLPIPKRYLYIVASNLVVDFYRHRGVLDIFSLDILDENEDICEWYEAACDPEPPVLETACFNETVREIFALIEQVAPDQRELATLLIQGCPDREIAEKMGLVKATVKTRIWRLRQKLNMERSQIAL
jgi:RNA polymerase sigma factor (sigma-70 family)